MSFERGLFTKDLTMTFPDQQNISPDQKWNSDTEKEAAWKRVDEARDEAIATLQEHLRLIAESTPQL
jgi:hypothetical protein